MGGYWAYKTLGWGGYWGWDPVENTSLVPWLFTAALVHGMFLQRAQQAAPQGQPDPRLLRVRDDPLRHVPDALGRPRGLLGPLVHRPRDHGLARRDPRLVFVAALDRSDRVALAGDSRRAGGGDRRSSRAASSSSSASPSSARSAFVILLGTSAPLLTRLSGNPSQVQTSFYGKTTTPAALLLVLLCRARAVRLVEGRDAGGSSSRDARRSLARRGGRESSSPSRSARGSRRASLVLFFAASSRPT